MNGACRPARRLRLRLPATLRAIDGTCAQVRRLLSEMHLGGHGFAVQVLLREALNNAVLHGCHEDAHRSVDCEVRVTRGWIVLRVADDGPGFDVGASAPPPDDPGAVSGRGLRLLSLYADRVRWNRAGNHVVLGRRIAR